MNLAFIQADPNEPNKRTPKDFWKEKFDPYANEAPKANRGEKEQESAPKKISGLGDDAYWASNRFGGMLYVLKGDAIISISLGGTEYSRTSGACAMDGRDLMRTALLPSAPRLIAITCTGGRGVRHRHRGRPHRQLRLAGCARIFTSCALRAVSGQTACPGGGSGHHFMLRNP